MFPLSEPQLAIAYFASLLISKKPLPVSTGAKLLAR
jgi:hypothetical protein